MSRVRWGEDSSRLLGDSDRSLHVRMRGTYIGVGSDAVEGHRVGVALLQHPRGERWRAAESDGVAGRVEVCPCDSVANLNGER